MKSVRIHARPNLADRRIDLRGHDDKGAPTHNQTIGGLTKVAQRLSPRPSRKPRRQSKARRPLLAYH